MIFVPVLISSKRHCKPAKWWGLWPLHNAKTAHGCLLDAAPHLQPPRVFLIPLVRPQQQMMVDVIGVVTEVKPLGSVKRKTDQVELSRRDITLVDQGCAAGGGCGDPGDARCADNHAVPQLAGWVLCVHAMPGDFCSHAHIPCCSLKTVVVTLWGATAEGPGRELEEQADAAPVVAISSCRVSSYNGVSGMHFDTSSHTCLEGGVQCYAGTAALLAKHKSSAGSFLSIACCAVSSLQRSAVLVNPDLPEATALRQWWESSGCTAATSHVGEGLATAIK